MIKLAKPYIPASAYTAVIKVLKSGHLIQGKEVAAFEKALSRYLNIKYAVLVSSGTAALHLSLMAIGVKAGDEVVVPAFTFPATANVVELVGAKCVFVDIALDDFCIDPEKLEKAITRKTKAIIVVHEFGQAADIQKILKIAQKYHLKIIEDAACSLGAEYKGRKVGTFGHLGCFSFHPRKALTTGEGGALVTPDRKLAEKIRSLRNHGIGLLKGRTDFIAPGLNYRMTDLQAVLGLSQMSHINKFIRARIQMARFYDKQLKNIDWLQVPRQFKERKAIYQTYHLLISKRAGRDRLKTVLYKNGIETNLGAQAVPAMAYYRKKYRHRSEDFPNAYRAFTEGLALPLGMHLNKKNLAYIVKKIKSLRLNIR